MFKYKCSEKIYNYVTKVIDRVNQPAKLYKSIFVQY